MELFKLILIIVLAVIMLASAVYAVVSKKTVSAVLATGVISLLASVIFLMLASPDVAMTEAAIGAGLTTFLFFIIIRKIEKQDDAK